MDIHTNINIYFVFKHLGNASSRVNRSEALPVRKATREVPGFEKSKDGGLKW